MDFKLPLRKAAALGFFSAFFIEDHIKSAVDSSLIQGHSLREETQRGNIKARQQVHANRAECRTRPGTTAPVHQIQ